MSKPQESNKLCIGCRFYIVGGETCSNQGSSYYYRKVPKAKFECKKYLEKKKK